MMSAGEGPLHSAAKTVRQKVLTSHTFRAVAACTATSITYQASQEYIPIEAKYESHLHARVKVTVLVPYKIKGASTICCCA